MVEEIAGPVRRAILVGETDEGVMIMVEEIAGTVRSDT